jgi:hypothetical protein
MIRLLLSSFLFILFCQMSFEPVTEECNCDSAANRINLILKYGITARNVLNTFSCTYTKDLVLDPPITTCLKLTIADIDSIYNKMNQINFFNYPDVFYVQVTGDTIGMVSPYSTYYFYVESAETKKELLWSDSVVNPDQDADKLRELIQLIRGIVESKNEYKKLPPVRWGYN